MRTGYGKIYEQLYTGSMVGAGWPVFALMPYVIANQYPASRDPESEMLVELNARLLAGIFGVETREVAEAIKFLCEPDQNSRSKEEGGRRLVQVSQFTYRVVNGRHYRKLADEERRRETYRASKARRNARNKAKDAGVPLPGEEEYVAAVLRGANADELNAIVSKWQPKLKGSKK